MAGIQQLLGANIRKLRKLKGWTQAELAEKINITTPFMTLIELGQRGVSLGVVEDIATVFEVPISTLFETHIELLLEKENLITKSELNKKLTSLENQLSTKITSLIAESITDLKNQ